MYYVIINISTKKVGPFRSAEQAGEWTRKNGFTINEVRLSR